TGTRFAPRVGEQNQRDKPLLEIRSTGGQTMFPPSVHPGGESVSWGMFNDPGRVDAARLLHAAGVLAAASLLFRNFPEKGARFNAYGAMIGALLRSGVAEETVKRLVEIFTDKFSGPARARQQSVAALQKRLATGDGTVPGFPRLAEIFGSEVARRCREWLQTDADWQRCKGNVIIAGSLHNMRLALSRLDVRLRYDEF